MTDFVRRVLRPERPDWIVRSLLDVDFYKFTMGYFIWKNYRGVDVEFRLINRNKKIPLAQVVDENELRAQLDHVRTLRFRRPGSLVSTDLYYLRGMNVYGKNMFSEEYLDFLARLALSEYELTRVGDQYELVFRGPWEVVTFWETIALAIISELYYRALMRRMNAPDLEALYTLATAKLYDKLRVLKQHPAIRFADFGQRRRHSFLWQQKVVSIAREVLGAQFTGTSNTWMAFNQDLMPIGTNAHELPMVVTALATNPEEMRSAQYRILRGWQDLFGEGLRIILPDTYGSAQFLRGAPKELAGWRGFRQDSGDPIVFGNRVIGWYRDHGIDPKEKLIIFSDGLDVKQMLRISNYFTGEINFAFGWGTLFTNDFIDCHPGRGEAMPEFNVAWGELFRPFSLVCKVASANGRPAVKLSDNIEKATGDPREVRRYVDVFGHKGRVDREVVV